MSVKKVYVDHSATSPVDPLVLEAMLPYFSDRFGNPSALYSQGRDAHEGVEVARAKVADALGAEADEIIFTSGGTESDNLGIIGTALAREQMKGHVITSSIEHLAVLNSCKHLEECGIDVTYLPVNEYGEVGLDVLQDAMRDDTFLVSIGYANQEIGTIQKIGEMAEIAHDNGALLHTDAVQAVGKVPINVKDLDVDLLTLSGHKIYGPKGIGALYVKKGVSIEPMQHGGGHERRLRAGTENVPGIVGLGRAMELGQEWLETDIPRIKGLRDRLISGILGSIENSYLNGHPDRRLPHNAHFRFSFIEGEAILLNLDYYGISASTGSACSSRSLKASHVLLAIGLKHEDAHGSLRFTLGRSNTEEDIDWLLVKVPEIVAKLREISPLGRGADKER
ncbi:MAG: cysteine desulfurase NifS [Candidatus Proteinoplasmatales archaeon SG8-5]|nr:MAG: cysteine desulfurase NifS [Candidatus Proteinoplasmatales archaeon SG8-5]